MKIDAGYELIAINKNGVIITKSYYRDGFSALEMMEILTKANIRADIRQYTTKSDIELSQLFSNNTEKLEELYNKNEYKTIVSNNVEIDFINKNGYINTATNLRTARQLFKDYSLEIMEGIVKVVYMEKDIENKLIKSEIINKRKELEQYFNIFE